MKANPDESGLEELLQLSKSTAKQAQNFANIEKQREVERQTSQSVLQGLRKISFSVAIEQLKSVAPDEIIQKISSLANKPDTNDLRKLISDLVHNLEQQAGAIAVTNNEMIPLSRSIKTITILIELLLTLRG